MEFSSDFPSLRGTLTKTGDGKLRLFVKSWFVYG